MHYRFIVDTLEKGTGLIALFETGSGDICAPRSEDAGEKAAGEGAVGDVVDVVLAKEGQERFLVSATEGIVLSLIVAWLYVVVLGADGEVVADLVLTKVG